MAILDGFRRNSQPSTLIWPRFHTSSHLSRHRHLAGRAHDRLRLRRLPFVRSARPSRLRSPSISKRRRPRSWSIPARIFAPRRCDENIRRVDAVVFTHSHTDHIMGFDDLRRFCRATRRADAGLCLGGNDGGLGTRLRFRLQGAEPVSGLFETGAPHRLGPFSLGETDAHSIAGAARKRPKSTVISLSATTASSSPT